jgi:hypothetical protein
MEYEIKFSKKRHKMGAPDIAESTREEREAYINQKFRCISDCDMCGICAAFHGQLPENVYRDYIDGKREFMEITAEFRA